MKPQTSFSPSHWESTTFLRPPDLLIVGAGLTGLQAALAAKEMNPARDVLVVERAAVPRGASTRNAGFACFGGPTELLADLDGHGAPAMVETVRQRYAGVEALRRNFGPRGIDWHEYGGYEVIDEPATEEMVRRRLPELNGLLAEVTGQDETWSPTHTLNGHFTLHNTLEAQLHPGKLVRLLVDDCHRAGVRFLFGTEVRAVRGGGVDTADFGEIRAGQVLLTVNAFARDLLPAAFGQEIRPVRNQVMLSRPLTNQPLCGCYHYHEGYVYFRNVGPDRILIGGARHLAGAASETDRFGPNEAITAALLEHLDRWLPGPALTADDFPTRWSGIIAQGGDKTPVLEFTNDGVLVAGRLAGMGVALSADLGRRAAGMVG